VAGVERIAAKLTGADMKDEEKGKHFQQTDWLQYWTNAAQEWQRAYSWALDGFMQRAERGEGAKANMAWNPEDLPRMWSRMMETWTAGMGAMPASGIAMPGASSQQEITSCASQAYFATMTNLMRWWMRMAQSWGEYARNAASKSATAMPDGVALNVFADETRAQMRKVVEISFEECALMQRQMEGLAEQIRNIAAGSAADLDPRRRARAKD
jgi:hypothetical protein